MPATDPTRKLIVLGSTGSIGVNTLRVVDHLRRTCGAAIEVVGLAAGRQVDQLIEQARRFDVGTVAIADGQAQAKLRAALGGAKVLAGAAAAKQMVEQVEATDVSAAMVGSAGLPATLAAIRKGMTVQLANKETLVAAGALVSSMCRDFGATLIPVDSEHSAIFQCLAGRANGVAAVKRIVLTASGGPFRTVNKQTMANATVESALNHPTWNMGPKITIDSATMMNKALEIVEAHWLFDLPGSKIKVIVHPQSVVHSFVEFEDGSILAQLGPPDMKTPIQYALTWPKRLVGCSELLDWTTLQRLDFHEPDFDKFESLRLAYAVVEAGGTAGAIFNGANEAAVAAFLERKIAFGRIVALVDEALSAVDVTRADSLEAIDQADRQARAFVNDHLEPKVVVNNVGSRSPAGT